MDDIKKKFLTEAIECEKIWKKMGLLDHIKPIRPGVPLLESHRLCEDKKPD